MSTPTAAMSGATPAFYAVSPRKFNLLFYTTLGIYGVYWSYRHWRAQRDATGLDCWPIMRGLFVIFFVHSLLRNAATRLKETGRAFEGNPESLATTIVLLIIVSNVCDRLAYQSIGSPYTDWVSVLVLPILGSNLLKAQVNLNLAAGDPDGASNAALSGANVFWLVFGGLLWLMVLFGLYAVTFAPELVA